MTDTELAELCKCAGLCPICLGRYLKDGSHITPSGAHIPAQPKEVTAP